MQANTGRAVQRTVFWLVLLVSLIANGFQGSRLLKLEYALNDKSTDGALPVGTSVPSIQGMRLGGRLETIGYSVGQLPTMLYVFQPSCVWCLRNHENITALTEALAGKYRLIGLSLATDGLDEYVKKRDIRFPVYTDLTPDAIEAYRLESTPETLVISPEGKVIKNWQGAYFGNTASLVEKFFSITLPAKNWAP